MSFFEPRHTNLSSASALNSSNTPFIGIQAKLNIGQSNNKYEKEADAAADRIVQKRGLFGGEPFITQSQTGTQFVQKADEDGSQEKGKGWHEEILSYNYFMPYEVMMIFHDAAGDKPFTIQENQKEVFAKWGEILKKQRIMLRYRIDHLPDSKKAAHRPMLNILTNLGDKIKAGQFDAASVKALKDAIKSTPFKKASEWKADQQPCAPITSDELIEILKAGDLEKQIANKRSDSSKWKRFCSTENNKCFNDLSDYKKNFIEKEKITEKINEAFQTMGIDTVKAQAVYIAHMAGETTNMMGMTEEKSDYMKGYRGGEKYKGRSPFHVTHIDGYIKTISYMEQLLKNPKLGKVEKERIRVAAEEIKKDISKASDPKYAFLFGAAYMQMSGLVEASGDATDGDSFDGTDSASARVAGQDINKLPEDEKKKFLRRAELKAKVYRKALEVLRNKKCATDNKE